MTDNVVDLMKRSGFGATIGVVAATDSDVDVGAAVGVQFGLAPKAGFGFTVGFGWFGADLLLDSQGFDGTVGSVDIRPLMAGLSYTWVRGRLATSVAINAGVSFNSADVNDEFRALFGPGATVELDMKDSIAVRPSVEVEYEITPKFAITGWGGYLWTKIDSSLTTPVGRFEDEWNASSFLATVGVMVYPFR